MTLLSPPFALGASGQVLSGRNLRHTLGALWLPTSGMAAHSGVLPGPSGSVGELTLNGAGTELTVQGFRAVVQSTQDTTAGQYMVTNDGPVTLPVPAQDASQFRRALVVVRVDDSQVSGVASSPTTDRAVLEIVSGALATSIGSAALPAAGNNPLLLGELQIPPTGQTTTVTPYNPRTGVRGGVLPVFGDTSTLPGHGGMAGTYDGQARLHPTRGLEFWSVYGSAWQPSQRTGFARLFAYATVARTGFAAGWQDLDLNAESIDTHGAHTTGAGLAVGQRYFTVPEGQAGRYRVGGGCSFSTFPASSIINSRVMVNSAVIRGGAGNSSVSSAAGSASVTGEKILELAAGNTVHIQGYCSAGPWDTGVYTDGGPWLAVERID